MHHPLLRLLRLIILEYFMLSRESVLGFGIVTVKVTKKSCSLHLINRHAYYQNQLSCLPMSSGNVYLYLERVSNLVTSISSMEWFLLTFYWSSITCISNYQPMHDDDRAHGRVPIAFLCFYTDNIICMTMEKLNRDLFYNYGWNIPNGNNINCYL